MWMTSLDGSAVVRARTAHAGYTLIEILIVMLIISIVGAVSLLTVSANKNSQLENFSKQLTNLITLAEQQAMLQPAVLGLLIQNQTLRFYQFQAAPDQYHKSAWVPLDDPVLRARKIPKNIEVQLTFPGSPDAAPDAETTHNPQLIISTNGDLTPFIIYLGEKNSAPRYQIVGSDDGSLTNSEVTNEK
jgi:general secretion pathway protein H